MTIRATMQTKWQGRILAHILWFRNIMSQSVGLSVTQSVSQTRKMDWKANTNIVVGGGAFCLLECDTNYSGKNVSAFRKDLLPPPYGTQEYMASYPKTVFSTIRNSTTRQTRVHLRLPAVNKHYSWVFISSSTTNNIFLVELAVHSVVWFQIFKTIFI
jgi:hypothetical protein